MPNMSDSVNVLMVDDELVVLEAFVDILEDEGYTMFMADSGDKAVDILRANPIDIVVTDINMPEMDGLELLSIIHEMDANIPVIMATAYSSIESTVESMKRGASNYLIKPIKVELLRSVLAEAATKRRMLRENRELVDTVKKNNDELKQLNTERQRVFEAIAQNVRQPLIDQMNWCELLMSDAEHSLHTQHQETTGQINRAAEDMLAQVLELLDEEKIEHNASAGQEDVSTSQETASPSEAEVSAPLVVDPVTNERMDFKILLVEDSSTLRDILVGVLRRRFHVLSAPDGWEGLRLIVEKPDLILTELNLPCVDVLEMLRCGREIGADAPVLAMYDPEDKALLAATETLGVEQTLLKPFRIADLAQKVEALAEASAKRMNGSILVVCPDATERYALYCLFDSRYHTHIAASPEAAMDAADTHFDLLVVDAASEEYLWQEVVTLFRRKNRYLKVLALMDGGEIAVLGALKKAGVGSVMLKPYAFDDLLARVQDLLGIKRINERILRSVFRKLA